MTCHIIAMSTKLKLIKSQTPTLEQNYRGCWLDYAVFNGHTVLRVHGVNFKRVAQLTIVLEF